MSHDAAARANTGQYELSELPPSNLESEEAELSRELERMRQLIHDLRNPVGSMSMAIEMLAGPLSGAIDAMEPEMGRRVAGTLGAMTESARQLRHLVSDIGQLAVRASTGVVESAPAPLQVISGQTQIEPVVRPRVAEVAMDELLERLAVLIGTRSELAGELHHEGDAGVVCHANGAELLRAMCNLVDNGIEASAKGCKKSKRAPAATVRILRFEDEVVVEIENRGRALPARVKTWLEGPTGASAPSSGKSSAGLHGVGLTIARRVAEQHGGCLEGESSGGITVMRLRLPQ